MTPKAIRVRCDAGEWLRLDHGVYGHVAVPPTWERSLMAAVLAEPWARISHRASAVLHEFHGYRRGRPEVTIRPNANARGALAIAHRGVDVRSTTVRGIPVVTVAQTFVDLAQISSEAKVAAALSHRAAEDRRILEQVRDRYCELAPKGGRDLRSLKSIYHQLVDEPRWVRRIVLETGARRTVELRGTKGRSGAAHAPNRRAA